MTKSHDTAGYFRSGLPYSRSGRGPRILVIFEGLGFENKPMPRRMAAGFYGFLEEDYTIYRVTRKPGLPREYSMQNMSDDYAAMIQEEFAGPVGVIGFSTGGSIAQHFAADHPDLVRRLVLHSTAHTLGKTGKEVQRRIGELAQEGHRREASTTMLSLILPPSGFKRYVGRLAVWIAGYLLVLLLPKNLSDLVITIEAEDRHHFKDRLSEITAPTLVVAGDKDPFYSATLFRETAEGIPHATLILYEGMGHPASGKHFRQDVLTFLKGEGPDLQAAREAAPQVKLSSLETQREPSTVPMGGRRDE